MNEKQLQEGLFERLNYEEKIKILEYVAKNEIVLNFELR